MRWLELFGIGSNDPRPLELSDPECWRVEGTRDAVAFYRALVHLTSPGTIVYLEDTTEKQVPAFLRTRALEPTTPLKAGTLLPKPSRYHVPATRENLEELAALIEDHRIVYPAIHTHLYSGQQVVLEWYDAFSRDPMYVAAATPEASVARFASEMGCAYSWAKHAA